jgi:hypothetical protein
VSKTSARNSEASTYISSRFALGASIGFLLVGTSASLPVFFGFCIWVAIGCMHES